MFMRNEHVVKGKHNLSRTVHFLYLGSWAYPVIQNCAAVLKLGQRSVFLIAVLRITRVNKN